MPSLLFPTFLYRSPTVAALFRSWTAWLWLLAAAGAAPAAERFCAPNGSPDAPGTIDRPWSLAKALGHGLTPGPKPGDIVWLRGGVYYGAFEVHASGAPGKPVIFRNYPGERVRIDGRSDQRYTLLAMGDYIWFWGLEVMSSDPRRLSAQTGSFPTDIFRGPEVGTAPSPSGGGNSSEVKFINMILHDGFNSFIAKESLNTELYGNVIYYDGWDAPDRGHGHSLYMQNGAAGTKRVEDNILFASFSHGLHIYSTDDFMQGFYIEGNVSFDNGKLSATSGYTRNYLVGAGDDTFGGDQVKNIVFKNNFAYYSPVSSKGAALHFGSGKSGCANATITDNYLASPIGGAIELVGGANCAPIMSGNTLYGTLTGMTASSFPNNTYLSSSQKPSGVKIWVRPNRYENGRANIVIYNWDLKPAVAVDVSAILRNGDDYEVRDAQNFLGDPVLKGRYQGGPITIPMASTVVPSPVGNIRVPVNHTSAEFGVFVLITPSRTYETTGAPSPVNLERVLNAGSLEDGPVAPGSIVSLFGSGLSTYTELAAGAPLPYTLGGGSVRINGSPAPLYFASPVQVNAQVPYEITPGPASFTASVGDQASQPVAISVARAAPGLFQAGGRALVQNADYTLNTPSNPAAVDSVVTTFCTGQGPVDQPVRTGEAAPLDVVSPTSLEMTASIGGEDAPILFAGLAPGMVGVCQVNLRVPQVGAGDRPLRISLDGRASAPALMSVTR